MYSASEIVIYFDMDGVLADFDAGKDRVLGRPTPELNQPWENLTPAQQTIKNIFWEAIEHSHTFFRTLPPLNQGLALYQALSQYKRVILTASPEFGGCDSEPFKSVASQKFLWCQEHLGGFPQVDFICTLSHLKHEHLAPQVGLPILIDDRLPNCQAWADAGGHAIYHDPKRPELTIRHLLELGLKIDSAD